MSNQAREPLLTIRCLVYNHGKYLRQCFDGFLMQKTDFAFQILVHDDASTDDSVEIIREYESRYPQIFKVVLETENQFSKKSDAFRRFTRDYCLSTKYLAYCEGDDYWVDPYKLQKQVDYLESHPNITCSCTRYKILSEKTGEFTIQANEIFDNKAFTEDSYEFTRDDAFLKRWQTQTLTLVLRTSAYKPEFFDEFKSTMDVYLIYCILSHGNGVCHRFIGGVYRQNDGGVYSGLDRLKQANYCYLAYSKLYNKTHDYALTKRYKSNYELLLKAGLLGLPKNIFEFRMMASYYINRIIIQVTQSLDTLRVNLALRSRFKKTFNN